MSGFKALNIESDDESDIEVDDTKEIQIEEALKLFEDTLAVDDISDSGSERLHWEEFVDPRERDILWGIRTLFIEE